MDNFLSYAAGSLLTLAGTWLTHWLNASKERREWERKAQAETAAWERARMQEESAELREAYQDAISWLLQFDSVKQGLPDNAHSEADPRLHEIITNVHKAVSRIYLSHPTDELQKWMWTFAGSPMHFSTDLQRLILNMAAGRAKTSSKAASAVATPVPTGVAAASAKS